MRLIDADLLYEDVELSLLDNPHKPGMIRVNHTNEHQHFLNLILKADTIEAEPVIHAYWSIESDADMPNPMFKLVVCSACNKKANEMYKYCPNCGAKMDLKAEGTDE